MPTIGATDLDTLEVAIDAALRGITPIYQRGSTANVWKKHRDKDRRPGLGARWYRVEWDADGYTEGGFIGPNRVDTSAILTLVVDYGGVPEDVMRKMVARDFTQVRDVLNALKETTAGLWWIDGLDHGYVVEDNQAQAELIYRVRYMETRAV